MMDDDNYIITASGGGQDRHPAWYYNLTSNPQVTIQVKDRQMTATAEPAQGEERSRLWAKLMEVAPGYGEYANRTTKEIPMVILHPENAL